MPKAFDFKTTVPWGRSFTEYCAFFALDGLKKGTRILDCGAGPSSFTVEAVEAGFEACAVDPLYSVSVAQIAQRIEEVRPAMLESIRQARTRFVWDHYETPEKQEEVRLQAMRRFLEDCSTGHRKGRYVAGTLPYLPFPNSSFDIALSSHFLLLYSRQFDFAFHLAAVREMLRVAMSVRIFPLLDLDGQPSGHVSPLRAALAKDSIQSRIEPVTYEFQKGGNEMLRLWRRA